MGDLTDDRRPPISGETRLAAVIGAPVRHSLSPTLLNAAFAEAGLDWHFMALEVAEGQAGEALDAVRALGLVGLSVTMPHKAAVAAAVDHRTDEAEALDAVNCVVVEGDRLVGHNTDGDGFLDGLRHDTCFDPSGRSTVGPGGRGSGTRCRPGSGQSWGGRGGGSQPHGIPRRGSRRPGRSGRPNGRAK